MIESQWQHRVKLLKQMMAMEQMNPVVQRVKLIMAAGLVVIHAHRYEKPATQKGTISKTVSPPNSKWVFLHDSPADNSEELGDSSAAPIFDQQESGDSAFR